MRDLVGLIISPEMLSLVAEIDEFKGTWKLLGKLAPERLASLKKVASIESIGSSTRIEGSKLSDKEVELLLSRLDKHSFRSRDEEEVAGYAYVCEEIFTNFSSIPLTENMIKQLHSWLLKYSPKEEYHRGGYKKTSNNIEAFDGNGKSLGVLFETTSLFDTPFKMEELVFKTREALETRSLHPLLIIAIFIVNFLAIHPFQDGNGRLSRCLCTLLLLQAGYQYVPYASLESIVEENKESYYLALRKTQLSLKGSVPDYTPLLLFFLRSLQKQKIILSNRVSQEKLIYLHLSKVSTEILTLVAEHGRLSMSELELLTKGNRNTLKKHINELTKQGHIVRHGKGRATWYTVQ